MKKLFKKLIVTTLTATMVLGMTTAAFAEGSAFAQNETTGVYGASTEVEVTTKEPTISVTVPTSASFKLNPYKMTVDGKTDQIICTPIDIVSASELDLEVGVNAAATIDRTSALKLLTAEPTKPSGDKWAVVKVVLGATADELAAENNEYTVPLTTKATDMAKKYSLGKTATVKLGFVGSANDKSTGTWTDDDKCTVVLKYTFTPKAAEAQGGGNDGGNDGGDGNGG